MPSNDYQRLRNTGCTPEQYLDLMDEQRERCAICGEKNGDGRELHADHDHATGKIRGLLCFKCNTALGLFRDSPRLLARAIVYLEESGISY